MYVFTTGFVGKIYRTVRMIFFCFIERDEMRVIDVLEVECRTANNAKSVDCNVKHQVLAPVLVVFAFSEGKRRWEYHSALVDFCGKSEKVGHSTEMRIHSQQISRPISYASSALCSYTYGGGDYHESSGRTV